MAKLIDGVDAGGQKITNVADPTTGSDGMNKSYADAHYTGSGATRATATATTVSLAPSATDTSTTITLSQGYRLYSIQTSRPARVELYDTAAQMTADATRAFGAAPDSAAGVAFDYITPAAATTYTLSPLVEGVNLESSPSAAISMRVTNMDVSTGTVTVTLVWIRTE